MCASKANFRGSQPASQPANTKSEERRSRAQLLLSRRVLPCCKEPLRQWATNAHAADCKKKPARPLYGFHCMAHAMWLGKKYAIFENYTQCSSLAHHERLSLHQHAQACAALLTGSERTTVTAERESKESRDVSTHSWANFRFTLTQVAERHFHRIQFEFSLRCVQTCSEENPRRKAKSKLYNNTCVSVYLSVYLHKYLYLSERTAVRTFVV